jgi:UDP-N-acetylglucosamine--N-acetylmuramyl-(pentapeptide) pyrophosphoryl-undecaprenol N-acetylglucosamine transferase
MVAQALSASRIPHILSSRSLHAFDQPDAGSRQTFVAFTRSIRIVLAGGGTGGHVLPAVSVIEELKRREVQSEYLWIGSNGGVEREAAERIGIAYVAVSTGKFRRYLDLQTLLDAGRIPIGIVQAYRHLRVFKPNVVFSTGGFVSVPTVVAGARVAPILTHEQTAIVGLATKINARFADVLALSHEQSRVSVPGFTRQVTVTGNPVRLSLLDGDASRGFTHLEFDPKLPLLYVTGGARGSSPINQRIEALLPELLDHCQILHQTGHSSANEDSARLQRLSASWSEERQRRYRVVEFVGDELKDVYAAATLVLARAGAGTIAELPLLGKPAILIPLPLSGGGEQDVNARILEDAGAAVFLPQSEATPDRLRTEILTLLFDAGRRQQMAAKTKTLARPDAASRLTEELLELANW